MPHPLGPDDERSQRGEAGAERPRADRQQQGDRHVLLPCLRQEVGEDGATYDAWVFAPHAEYWSPYFGNSVIDLQENPISVEDSASMEALSYSVEFDDWRPLDFECFPGIEGVTWKTHFGATRKRDGVFMDFFAYSFVRSNEYGEITHWETHVNAAYNDFLDIAIGEHGPYDDADRYMAALVKKLASAGIDLAQIMHATRKI